MPRPTDLPTSKPRHAPVDLLSGKGQELVHELIAARKAEREKTKSKTKSTKVRHFVTVDPATASLVLKESHPTAAQYARKRTRGAAKLISKNYRKLFAARSLRNYIQYCYGVYQGVETATVYPRDCDISQLHPTIADTIVRNAGGVGNSIGFSPSMPLKLTVDALDRLHEWAALQVRDVNVWGWGCWRC
jgi:hypothetical protein